MSAEQDAPTDIRQVAKMPALAIYKNGMFPTIVPQILIVLSPPTLTSVSPSTAIATE
ncbi:MAG: hypothetical protein KME19_21115 [Microcoleus vaginatus WJT46-NPBG5]|nr:hypothetical protein [Microcoleus vaginatus WJT46-NPBG5]